MDANLQSAGNRVDHVALLRKYLTTREKNVAEYIAQPFVTLSREAGAGSHALAREILRELDKHNPDESREWEVFDQKLCVLLAQDKALRATFEGLLAEQYHSEVSEFISDMISGQTRQYSTYKRTFEIVRGLAMIGKVVIVGRAGNCVTEDMPLGVRVRLVASEDVRVARMMEVLNTSRDKAMEAMHELDRERAHLIHDFFNRDINDPHHYDAIFNVSTMSLTEIAQTIVTMLQCKIARTDRKLTLS